MFKNDLIDKKIDALLDYTGEKIDETNELDIFLYAELREFAEEHDGLLYFLDEEVYLIINIIGQKDFVLIPVDYVAES